MAYGRVPTAAAPGVAPRTAANPAARRMGALSPSSVLPVPGQRPFTPPPGEPITPGGVSIPRGSLSRAGAGQAPVPTVPGGVGGVGTPTPTGTTTKPGQATLPNPGQAAPPTPNPARPVPTPTPTVVGGPTYAARPTPQPDFMRTMPVPATPTAPTPREANKDWQWWNPTDQERKHTEVANRPSPVPAPQPIAPIPRPINKPEQVPVGEDQGQQPIQGGGIGGGGAIPITDPGWNQPVNQVGTYDKPPVGKNAFVKGGGTPYTSNPYQDELYKTQPYDGAVAYKAQ